MATKIIFTGGGSSGHVTPNIALIEKCRQENLEIEYIGSRNGIEQELIKKLNIKFHSISSGKLRRYFSWQNFIDPFKIFYGCIQASFILFKRKPQLVFSKGGFVSFPVVLAAWLQRIPVVIHESDFYPGLANKLAFPFANKICVTFAETKQRVKYQSKVVITGTPIREAFFMGNGEKARELCGFRQDKQTILIFGGGLGAKIINDTIREILPKLRDHFNMVHICGKGKMDSTFDHLAGYKQFEYLHEELFDVMALADIVISRSGANSLYELLVLRKPHILIPLSKNASRGDQIDNANYFAKLGLSLVIPEETLTPDILLKTINNLQQQYQQYKDALDSYACPKGTDNVLQVIHEKIKKFNSNKQEASL